MMLIENTLFGERSRVDEAIDRIRKHTKDALSVGFSGGKDSVVIKKLVEMSGVKAKYIYNNTTCDPPELLRFIKTQHKDVIWSQPKKTMWQLVREKGLPTRIRRWCCDHLKERYSSGVVALGIRAEESRRRSKRKIFEQDFKKKNKWFLNPILDWSESDVWDFIDFKKLPYCELYDEDCIERIGCVLCPHVRNIEAQQQRWPKICRAWKLAAIYFYDTHPHLKVRESFSSGEEFYSWWLARDVPVKNKNQMELIYEPIKCK